MTLHYDDIQAYAAAYTSPASDLLARINQETHTTLCGAQMLSGHLQGQVLVAFSKMIRPARILEIGTYAGYATLCLAEGLTEEGVLHTIDSDVRLRDKVLQYANQHPRGKQIAVHTGKALDILPQLSCTFDLVFIDADKRNYLTYYEMVLEKLNPNGWIIIDNVLWKGKVLHEAAEDKLTKAMIHFNNHVKNDLRVVHVLFPVRDGLMVVRKR